MNAADPKQVKNSKERAELLREQELRDFGVIVSTREGRRYVWNLLKRCHIFTTSWEPSAKIHFNEGERNVGLRILTDINEANPAAYAVMQSEAKKDEVNV